MAEFFRRHLLFLLALYVLNPNFAGRLPFPYAAATDDLDVLFFHGDYTPPQPPPPSLPPQPPSLTCERDLNGFGSLDTSCTVNTSLDFPHNVYIEGLGSLYVLPHVNLTCFTPGCSILVNISGDFVLDHNAVITAGTFFLQASNAALSDGSLINVTALGGPAPPQTSGTPTGIQGAGGGHGGRGANCLVDNTKLPDDVWGGDTYSWSTLSEPFSYGSQGGTTVGREDFGGGGGGRIRFELKNAIDVSGSLLADGGNGGPKGGGGSGGSIYVLASRMTGNGRISASGGDGFAGGGGGRISINVFSRHDDPKLLVHGGRSLGCPENSGAAGTYYDAVPRSLIVSNHNMTTTTDTLLLEFPNQPLWTNVYIRNSAKACVPLLWSRVQIQGQLHLSCGAALSFGLAHFATSEFELMAEELLMSDSIIKVYGALRMSVKMHLMWNSRLQINGDGDAIVATSLLEASNLVVLKESSVIHSNANLGVHGQGFLNLSGPGDIIEAQHLVLSLFSCICIGQGAVLRGPLENASNYDMTPQLYCDLYSCPIELLHPPEDCNVNSSLSFTLQICRVEDVIVEGIVTGSVVHFHWIRNVAVLSWGVISASGLGCTGGVGRGKVLSNGLGGGGGHGGKGGDGYYNDSFVEGGVTYGDPDLPCELGSGSGLGDLAGTTAGGGIIVMGSRVHSLAKLSIDGSLSADGESFGVHKINQGGVTMSNVGPGGGSGGTILIFVQTLNLAASSTVSTQGGCGSPYGGGGGGGGRVHFHWADISIGDKYLPIASVNGSIYTRGGLGRGQGRSGKSGTITGKACPVGLYGTFCEECPVGTFKNVTGSDRVLCFDCPINALPHRAIHVYVRGGGTDARCPYECISERYHMPHCYTALEELIYTFGGPWLFALVLLALLILLAIVLSVARMKYVGAEEFHSAIPARRSSRIDNSFPFLESLNEVLETNRVEESRSHVHRIFFMGPNTFAEPWHLSHSPPDQLTEIVYEDAFGKFVDEINNVASYQWWEGSIYSVLSLIAYPFAWLWLQSRRKRKLQRLREFVRSEYDHACMRSCRSRALYEGIKVAATSDLMLAHVDFFLGGDEKRADLPPCLQQRFPLSLIFGGDGSYMTPFSLQSDNILTSLMSQSIPPTIWYRLVAGLNAQLRIVRHGNMGVMFSPAISWLETHANLYLCKYGVRINLSWSQHTAFGYCQYGLVVCSARNGNDNNLRESLTRSLSTRSQSIASSHEPLNASNQLALRKKSSGGILNSNSISMLKGRSAIYWPFCYIVRNTKPIGHQDLVGLVISILLLGDFSLVLLTLLQFYSLSLLAFFLVLSILPLGILFPFPAGIKALFTLGPRQSANLARMYALWNITSLVNVMVAFVCGLYNFKTHSSKKHQNFVYWNFSMDESEWWMLPSGLVLCKLIQAPLLDFHVANQEIQDHSLYSNDPDIFWQT